MKKSKYISLANKIEVVHVIIFIITFISMIGIFLTGNFKIFSALWILGLAGIGKINGSCPLTVWERKLRIMAGENVKKTKFIPRFLHKYFRLELSDRLTEIWMTFYLFISLFVLITYFF
jgi:hypothetical protein